MKFKKLVESFGSENKMTIRVASGLNADGCDIVVTDAEGNILHKEEYRYGYNASHSKKWAEWYPEKPFMRDIIDGLCSKYGIDKSAITFKAGANVFSGTDVSDASVVEFRNNFVESLTETYWIDNKDVMNEVDRLGKELESDGFKYYSDRYSGSTYYNFFTKRGDSGAVCKAVQYNYNGAQIIDVTVDQLMGYEPIDSFEKMRRKLGNILLPKNEDVADGKEEDQFVLYFPYLEPRIINKERAIKQIEFELNNIKNDSGASLAGRGFGIYCLKSVDADTGTAWTGRYSSKEFLDVLHEDIKNESFEMAVGGDDFDGEIAAMRAEQQEREARRAARKERFALMHKLFDKHMDKDPNARWIDKIYDLFEDAEKVVFIGNKYGTLPGRTEDGQPIRYRYSVEEYDIYTDPYRDFVYIGTNNDDPLKEDLEDDFDLLMKASDLKCKLSRYDIEEANEPSELVMYMEDVYHALVDAYGTDKIKWWRFYEDDDMDGVKVIFKDGTKKIVEIVHGRVYESDNISESYRSAPSISTNEYHTVNLKLNLKESVTTQYVICGVTNEGTRMLYDAVNDNFTTDYASATKYDDMDVARDDWFKIPRSGFRRIFIPVYDPAVFESLNEGTGADTAHTASNALKIAAQGDKHKWAKTASEIIDVIPDEFADQMFDAVKEKASDIKLSAENKKKLVDASNGELTDKDVEDCDTLGKILALVDGFEWAEKNPGLLKGYIMVVLSIVAIIEPTPVLEIITLIVGFLPAEWVAKVLAVTNVVGNPLGAAGTIANKAYKHIKSKKDEAFDADKVQKRIACTTEFDNGHVFHNDYFRASSAEAEERAKQASIENPDKVFYVKYDDVMNPSSDIKWKNGEQLNEAEDEEPIYFDPDDEFEVDFRYYVYANNDDVVSDAFDFEEDAIAWAKENNYPIVKIHNYYRDTDGQLNPDGDPEVIWEA